MSEYEVVKVMQGTYTKPKIYVVHSCIEIPRSGGVGTLKNFKIGDLHKLIVSTEDSTGIGADWHGAEIRPKDHIYFYCRRVDKYRKWYWWLHNQALLPTRAGKESNSARGRALR